ncbi:MAG TPA: alpha/beta hydrolase [Vicinamibacterales bacterium]|nr:alpha/beta hydrolase [Vicinamibacterales bacterium]
MPFAFAAASGCNQSRAAAAIDKLQPCKGDNVPVDAYCGTLTVYENRETRQGRQIGLNIVVLPALSNDPKPDPFFFLAGGPGQGAAQMAKQLREPYRQILTDRDIVLVDQRGTGKSNPLNCIDPDDSLNALQQGESGAIEKLKKCLTGYDADLRLYTTTIAMDDLDDVRAYLGYDKINIYGGSYGTRAGLVYMRQHGDRVRTAVLDGVAPTNMRLPLFFARDVQRAFDRLIADCEKDTACNAAYPNLTARVRALVDRLEKNPPTVPIVHPRTGERGEFRVTPLLLLNAFAATLYQPLVASLIPALVERAEKNDFQGVFALAGMNEGAAENMSVGMQLSVICAEDAPRITPEERKKESEGTIFGPYVMRLQQRGCEFWPRGAVDTAFYEPVQSSIPTLILSGEIDPVTPPVWGEEIAKTLPNSRHIVIPGTGHTAGSTGCGRRLIKAFVDAGTAQNLDTSCVDKIARPPYFLTPAGPNPKPVPPKPGGAGG